MKNNVRNLREDRNYTQSELAEAVNVSRQTIHSIESGKFVPTTILALKLARLFDVSVEDIFILEDE